MFFENSFLTFCNSRQIIQNIHEVLSNWLNEMLDNSANEVRTQQSTNIENIQDLYAEGLFVLTDQAYFDELKIMFK